MKMQSPKFYFFSLLVLVFFSCKKESKPVDFNYEYFPMEEGTFVEYEVMKIHHDITHDTSVFLMKTVVGDTVIDNCGRIAKRFFRYVFDEISQEYKVQDLWTVALDQERVELVEENQRVIKLVFAPTLSKEWDKNAFNTYDPLMAFYDELHKPYFVNGITADSSIVVKEDQSDPGIYHHKQKYEVYGKGIGLMKKYYKDFSINPNDTLHPIYGDKLFYTIKNYGH